MFAENGDDRGVESHHFSRRIQRNHARGYVLQNRFHQFTAAFAFLNRKFEALRKLVNLPAAFSQLLRHAVERAGQGAEFVLRLHVNAVFEISARYLARRLRQRLDGYRHLLRKEQRDPGGGEQQQQRDQQQGENDLPFVRAKLLLLLLVRSGLRFNL